MMSPTSLLASLVIFLVAMALCFLFMGSGGLDKKARKRERKVLEKDPEEKGWEQATLRLEKHIVSLREKIAEFEKREKQHEKNLLVERHHVKHLKEKLAQEKNWRQQERSTLDASDQEFDRIKKDLLHTQRELENGHGEKLRLERELTEAKWELDALNQEKRQLSAKVMNLEANLDFFKKESAELKKTNAQLAKQTNEMDWIAKTEYDKLDQLYKQKEKELERIRRETRPS